MSGDALFAMVCLTYGFVILIALCILAAIADGIAALIDRANERRRRKRRNNYVRFR